MTRRRAPSAFRQQDVTRAIKAAVAAGVEIACVEVDTAGTIRIITVKAEQQGKKETNPWDRV
jgi:Tfp pilus assembly PilM family ATPase